jgi:hypothetical protein
MTSNRKRTRDEVHYWKCVFEDNVATERVIRGICEDRHQSDTYFFSKDRQSFVRFLALSTPGVKLAYVRAATTVHIVAISALLSPWKLPASADLLIPLAPACLPMAIVREMATFVVIPVRFPADVLMYQRNALSQFLTWLDDEGDGLDVDNVEMRMKSEHENAFMYQTDFHAMDLCFGSHLRNSLVSMDVNRFRRGATMIH